MNTFPGRKWNMSHDFKVLYLTSNKFFLWNGWPQARRFFFLAQGTFRKFMLKTGKIHKLYHVLGLTNSETKAFLSQMCYPIPFFFTFSLTIKISNPGQPLHYPITHFKSMPTLTFYSEDGDILLYHLMLSGFIGCPIWQRNYSLCNKVNELCANTANEKAKAYNTVVFHTTVCMWYFIYLTGFSHHGKRIFPVFNRREHYDGN